MNFNTIKKLIKQAFLVSRYSRTAHELLQLSESQLEDIGVSRALLKQGYRAYPWRIEVKKQTISDNVLTLSAVTPADQTTVMPHTSKAA